MDLPPAADAHFKIGMLLTTSLRYTILNTMSLLVAYYYSVHLEHGPISSPHWESNTTYAS